MQPRFLFLPVMLFLSACGGGGGGGNGSANEPPGEPPPPPGATEPDAPVVDYTGNTEPAQVDKSNAVRWAGLAVRMRTLSEQVEALWIAPPDEPGEISLTLQGNGGGSAHAEGLLRDDGTGFLEVTFDDYVEDGTTVSGRYIQRYVAPSAPQGGIHIFSEAGPGRLEFDNVELTFAGKTYTLVGALEISGGNHQRFDIDLLVTTAATGDVVYYESCAIDFADVQIATTSEIGAALSGTIYDSVMGAVVVTPTEPLLNLGFFEPAGFTVADPGGGFVMESAGPAFEFRSLSRGFAALLLDGDADGVPEEARRAPWSEIAGNFVRLVATPPVANAGERLFGYVGFDFTAHGLFSHDPDSDWLTFEWRLLWKPRGSQVQLAAFSNPVVSFIPDVEGDYLLGLRVSDGTEVRESSVLARVDLFSPVAPRGDSTSRGGLELVESFIAGVPVTINGRSAAEEPYLDNEVQWFAVGPGNAVLTETPDRFVRTFSTDADGLYTVNMENVEVTFPVGPQLNRIGVELVDPHHAYDVLPNDFNQDGRLDLALRLAGPGFPPGMQGFRLMIADPAGGFVDGPTLDTGRGEIAAGDLNDDGLLDFAVSDLLGVYVSLQLPDHGLADFALHPFPAGCAPFTPGDVGIGDVDGDGLDDLLAVALCDASLVVWRQEADHELAAASVAFSGESIRYAAFGHFDADGLIDAALSVGPRDALPPAVAVARTQPGGTFQVTKRIDGTDGFTHPVVTVADTNGDGLDDIVTNDFVHGIRLHEQQPGGTFTEESIIPTGSAELTATLGAGDVDDDGDIDILVCSHGGLYVGVRRAGEVWSYFEYGSCVHTGESMNNFAAVMDFNGDGNSDVVATSENFKDVFNDSRILLDVFLGNVSNYSRPVQ